MSTPNNPSPAPQLQFPFMSNQQFGQAGPGPSTMAQNRPGIPPHQLQLLQQVTAAARSQGMNLSPQQISMVVAQMQSQGNNGNPQALMNALRSLGHGQGQGQGQLGPGGQGQGQGPMSGQGGMAGMQGMHMNMGMGMDMQQLQQGQQGQQGQGGQPSQHTMQQQRLQQMMQGQQPNMMPNMSPSQQYGNQQGRSGTPSGNDSARHSMPPPGPPSNPSPHPNQMQGMQGMPNQPRFAPNSQQQALLAHQHQQMLANPQFQALPPNQQQMQLMGMHQKMMSVFMANSQPQPQQSPHMQQTQQQGGGPGPEYGSNMQQSPMHQQSTPQGGPQSSLPPHMAPPRPASASSHHPPSPHHQGSPMTTNTPPPMNNQYMAPQPSNTGSPAPSSHSQQNQHHATPQSHQPPPPHSASPLSAQHTGPSPRQPQPVDVNGQVMGQPGVRPPQPPVFPPNSSGMTSQQQQQMAAAMNIFGQAAQAQGQQPNNQPARPNQPQPGPMPNISMGRPPSFPIPGVNPAEFPFDFRLIPVLRHAADPRWQSDMQSKNPQLLQAVTAAQGMINQGLVRPEIMQKMHQFYFATVGMNQTRQPPPGSAGMPPQMQNQFMSGMPTGPPGPGAGTPDRRDSGGPPSSRPPPPHTVSETPAVSAHRERDPKLGTPVVAAMPPPAWIPGQPTPTRQTPLDVPHAQSGPPGPTPLGLPVKEWEKALRMDMPITAIQQLPEETDDPTFGGKLAAMSDAEKNEVAEWLEVDKRYAGGMKDRSKQLQKKMFKWARNNDMDTPWWSVRKGERYQPPRSRLQILFPQDKEMQRLRRSHKGRRPIKL